jgi:Spy/CpxP family protein refolding chaperone
MQGAAQEDRRTIMQDQQKAIRAILTPDQQKTYDANVEKMRAQRPGGTR